jgi:hypothetical protein
MVCPAMLYTCWHALLRRRRCTTYQKTQLIHVVHRGVLDATPPVQNYSRNCAPGAASGQVPREDNTSGQHELIFYEGADIVPAKVRDLEECRGRLSAVYRPEQNRSLVGPTGEHHLVTMKQPEPQQLEVEALAEV